MYYVRVYESGTQVPGCDEFRNYPDAFLNFFHGHALLSIWIDEQIEIINSILNEIEIQVLISQDDTCLCTVKKQITSFEDAYSFNEKFELDTIKFKDFLIDWSKFIKVYENNGVPNLIYKKP